MRYFCFIALALSCGCAARSSKAPKTTSGYEDNCPLTQTLDPNAQFAAADLSEQSEPLSGQPSVSLRISNTNACGAQGTNCAPPAIIGEVTVELTLIAVDANGDYTPPQPGTYNLGEGNIEPNGNGSVATYATVTPADLDPAPVPLTKGQFVIDAIAWVAEQQRISSMSGHMDVTLPDGSHLVQKFDSVELCGR